MSVQTNRGLLVQVAASLATVALVAVFWRPLVAWFTGQPVQTGGSGEAVATQAGDVKLQLAMQPDPPKQAGNALLIEATDGNGKPLDDAEVRVTYSMPAMGAMPEMKGKADIEEKGTGRYRATFDLPMAGTYTITTEVIAPSANTTARHSLTVGSPGLKALGAEGGSADNAMAAADATPKPLATFTLAPPVLEYTRAAFAAYDAVRALLARDVTQGLAARAEEIATALRAAADAAAESPADVKECLREGMQTAQQLGAAKNLDEARNRFSEMSHYLVALAAADPRLQHGLHLFACPMFDRGFNKWFQRSPQLENPYMGERMPRCGSATRWEVALPVSATQEDHAHAEGEISHYTCSMHPAVKENGPGNCPICGMDLTPVTRSEVESGVITVDQGRRQVIGVKTSPVVVAPMELDIRALGVVRYDETKLVDITLKVDGYIHDLKVNATGEPVNKGDVLFTLYSPELFAAQQEYLLALKSESATNESLVRAAKKRLELWGLHPAQIASIAARGEPVENMPFMSPAFGYVLEKNVVEGGAIQAGERLFRIVPLSTVWVEADVYEQDLPRVKVGQRVSVSLPYMPERTYDGKVAYIYPMFEEKTRTGKVRIELPNKHLVLKPDMYTDVRFNIPGAERLQVPESAVIYTGPRTLVFVDLGDGRLRPQEVKLGVEGKNSFEVLDGLRQGDVVVTSGNFLIAAESRIRSAADYWSGDDNEAE